METIVNNRVREIRSRIHPDHWAHCASASNPADLPSRGLSPIELSVSQLWRRGPEWLQTGFKPSAQEPDAQMPSECASELKTSQSHSLLASKSSSVDSIVEPGRGGGGGGGGGGGELKPGQPTSLLASKSSSIQSILDPARCSTFLRLSGITATVLRAVQKFKNLIGKPTPAMNFTEKAELLWVKSAQATFTDFKTLMTQFTSLRMKKECGVVVEDLAMQRRRMHTFQDPPHHKSHCEAST